VDERYVAELEQRTLLCALTGQVQPQYSEMYTFDVRSDDAAALDQ